ncbi:hypothetical protein K505DRAFT_378274 [Melanomma pulvis-pyrius CBS 109.77]|uniref:Uncharacterized protein n=1 Tax=Melanomma pulvis-pyrius CBS 109.77 TaxID=1314802 RepID=A0A6A6X0A4_9PLEO|nr:hypothetical protein K505DRAFT_378274 [Melanomma pulvis-pyrius CBS 109.77]
MRFGRSPLSESQAMAGADGRHRLGLFSVSMSLTVFVGLGGRRPELFDVWPALTTSQEAPSAGVVFAEIAMVYWKDDKGDGIGCTKLSRAASRLVGQPLSPSDTGASLASSLYPSGRLQTSEGFSFA